MTPQQPRGCPLPGEPSDEAHVWWQSPPSEAWDSMIVVQVPCGKRARRPYAGGPEARDRCLRGLFTRPPCDHDECRAELALQVVKYNPVRDEAWEILVAAGRGEEAVMRYLQHPDPEMREEVGQHLAARYRARD